MVEKKTERWPAGPTELERRENELIIEIEAERLKDFHNHPFRIIRVMDDDEAVISMVEANIHRETILPTE